MKYEIEELIPIVARLAERYTSYESTSISYEKAEQLMGAVLYCIHETELEKPNAIALASGIPAQQTYKYGVTYVEEKVKKALELYNRILPDFCHYENQCLYDTFVTGLPEFFKWYDITFNPQDTILTLDYPVLGDLSAYTGIDKIYAYIQCIYLEQKFLKSMPENYVINLLSRQHKQHQELVLNICEIVFTAVAVHLLAHKPLSKPNLQEDDYQSVRDICMQMTFDEMANLLREAVKAYVKRYCKNCRELSDYLTDSVEDVSIRLINAAINGSLQQMI